MIEDTQLLPVAGFVLGYAPILVTPGPNTFAIGGIAALRGLRAVLPLCGGIATGASLLAAGICTATNWGRALPMIEQFARAVAVVLLLYVAARILFRQPPDQTGGQPLELSSGDKMATFLAGVATAVTNPITAAFFASQFLGALPDNAARMVALGMVPCLALSFGVTLGFVLSRPLAQRAAVLWHRPIRIASAAVIATAATIVGLPLLGIAPDFDSASALPAVLVFSRAS